MDIQDIEKWWYELAPKLMTQMKTKFGTLQSHDIEDALQETITKALTRFDSNENYFRDIIHFSKWSRKVVMHRCIDLIRKSKKSESLVNPDLHFHEKLKVYDRPQDDHNKWGKELGEAMIKLPLQQRVVLSLYLQGWDTKSIAELLEIRSATVRSLKRYGISKISEVIK